MLALALARSGTASDCTNYCTVLTELDPTLPYPTVPFLLEYSQLHIPLLEDAISRRSNVSVTAITLLLEQVSVNDTKDDTSCEVSVQTSEETSDETSEETRE